MHAAVAWRMLVFVTVAMIILPAEPASAAPSGLTTTEVSFTGSGGLPLHGSVVAPPSTGARLPGIVMVHGSGPGKREELLAAAEAFAQRGIVTLIYDKRTTGYSIVQRDYSVLADDALAGVQVLRARADVDPARVGIWGLSEGAWVAPLAATRSADVAFLITVGAVGVTPAQQTAWSDGEYLRHHGVSGSLLQMEVTGVRFAIGTGQFAEASYDPVPVWEQVRQPVLAVWGSLDRQAVPEESSRIIQQALERGDNTHYTIHFIPGVGHNLYRTFDDGFDHPDSIPSDYGDVEASWVNGLAHGLPAASADPAPHQDRQSVALAPLAWYEPPWLLLGAFVLLPVAFLSYPLAGAVRRIRGPRGASPVRGPARWLAATGLATVVGFVGYFGFMVVTAANIIGPVVLGRPIPWLFLQLLAIGTVAATIATAVAWWRHRTDARVGRHARLAVLLAAGVLFVPWAFYWSLLIP
jgi:dienelactone hydrolase